jgi:hypothetical protein
MNASIIYTRENSPKFWNIFVDVPHIMHTPAFILERRVPGGRQLSSE